MSLAMRRAKDLVKRATPAEKHVRSLLDEMGIRYTFQKVFCTEKRFFIVDFYLPKPHKLCLELDGSSHRNRWKYDAWRDEFLVRVRKLRVYRMPNENALELNAQGLKARLFT